MNHTLSHTLTALVAALIVASLVVISLNGLDVSGEIGFPDTDAIGTSEENLAERFSDYRLTRFLIEYPADSETSSPSGESLRSLYSVHEALKQEYNGSDVLSGPMIMEQWHSNGRLSEQYFVDRYDEFLNNMPRLRSLLLGSGDESHWLIHGGGSSEKLIQIIAPLLPPDATITEYSSDYSTELRRSTIKNEAWKLIVAAMLFIFLIELVITRRIRDALSLWIAAVLPGLVILALFSLNSVLIDVFSLLVPLQVFVIATSYGIHVYQHRQAHPELNSIHSLQRLWKVLFLAMLTTSLTVFALLTARDLIPGNLIIYLISGIVLSFIVAITVLPRLFIIFRVTFTSQNRQTQRITSGDPPGKVLYISAAALTLLPLVLFFTTPASLKIGMGPGYIFRTGSSVEIQFQEYIKSTGIIDTLTLYIDSGEEYGLIDPQVYSDINAKLSKLSSQIPGLSVLSYVDLVEAELERRYPGDDSLTDVRIGESLELLYSSEYGSMMPLLISRDYRYAQIRLGYPYAEKREELFTGQSEFLKRLHDDFSPYLHTITGGIKNKVQRAEKLRRILVWFPIAFFLCVSVLSFILIPRKRMLPFILLPPVGGLLLMYMTAYWFDMYISPGHLMILCIFLGLSLDDIVIVVLGYLEYRKEHDKPNALKMLRRSYGAAVLNTTAVLAAGFSVLLLSDLQQIFEAALLFIPSIVYVTLLTYIVLPPLFPRRLESR